ncbi:glutamyl-tRNA reductase, partial [Methylobacterium sp. WL6]
AVQRPTMRVASETPASDGPNGERLGAAAAAALAMTERALHRVRSRAA